MVLSIRALPGLLNSIESCADRKRGSTVASSGGEDAEFFKIGDRAAFLSASAPMAASTTDSSRMVG